MVMIVVWAIIQHGQASNRKIAPDCQKKSGCGMPVIRISFPIQTKALVSFQWGHPMRIVPINPVRQVQESLNLFPIGKVYLENIHGINAEHGAAVPLPRVIPTIQPFSARPGW